MRPGLLDRLAIAFAAVLAASLPVVAPATAKDAKLNPKNAPAQVGGVDEAGAYKLSAEELGYDCKRLAGRMQVRLLEARSYDPSQKSSALSRGMQSATKPVVGLLLGKASGYSADPDTNHANDIAMLRAYNARLAAKGCRTYDLDAELGPGPKSTLPGVRPRTN